MKKLKLAEVSGFSQIFVLLGMLLVAISLPIATKLVQQTQDSRSDAALFSPVIKAKAALDAATGKLNSAKAVSEKANAAVDVATSKVKALTANAQSAKDVFYKNGDIGDYAALYAKAKTALENAEVVLKNTTAEATTAKTDVTKAVADFVAAQKAYAAAVAATVATSGGAVGTACDSSNYKVTCSGGVAKGCSGSKVIELKCSSGVCNTTNNGCGTTESSCGITSGSNLTPGSSGLCKTGSSVSSFVAISTGWQWNCSAVSGKYHQSTCLAKKVSTSTTSPINTIASCKANSGSCDVSDKSCTASGGTVIGSCGDDEGTCCKFGSDDIVNAKCAPIKVKMGQSLVGNDELCQIGDFVTNSLITNDSEKYEWKCGGTGYTTVPCSAVKPTTTNNPQYCNGTCYASSVCSSKGGVAQSLGSTYTHWSNCDDAEVCCTNISAGPAECAPSFNLKIGESLVVGDDLCKLGDDSEFKKTSTGWSWKCGGGNFTTVSCSQAETVVYGHQCANKQDDAFCALPPQCTGTNYGQIDCENGRICCGSTSIKIDGVCGTDRNSCVAGTVDDDTVTDTSTYYKWVCKGIHGGVDSDTCQKKKSNGGNGGGGVDPILPGVTFNLPTLELKVRESQVVTATITPATSTEKIIFSSDNANIATIAADGLITGVAVGQTTVRALMVDSGSEAIMTVKVTSGDSDTPDPSGTSTLSFKVAFNGVGPDAFCLDSLDDVTVQVINKATNINQDFSGVKVTAFGSDVNSTAAKNQVFLATLDLGSSFASANSNNRIKIKGPWHLRRSMCSNGQTDKVDETTVCDVDLHKTDGYTYDFSGYTLLTGDINQDGTINSIDLGIIKTNYNAGSELECGLKGDLNLDGSVNSLDTIFAKASLLERDDE